MSMKLKNKSGTSEVPLHFIGEVPCSKSVRRQGLAPKLSIPVNVVFFGCYIYPGTSDLGGHHMYGIRWSLPQPPSSTTCLDLFLPPSSNLPSFS